MTPTLSQRLLGSADLPSSSALRNPQVGFSRLRCRECGAEYEPVAKHVCDLCFGPLEVVYDYDWLKSFFAGRASKLGRCLSGAIGLSCRWFRSALSMSAPA
jgi:threonine synthase